MKNTSKMFRRIMSMVLALVMIVSSFASAGMPVQAAETIKVACVGDSLTDGYLSTGGNKSANAYPARLQTMLGSGYQVGNFGKTGFTLLKGTNKSYWNSTEYTNSKAYGADIVIIMLGTNDSKEQYWDAEQYKTDAEALAAEYGDAEIIFATSPVCYKESTGAANDIISPESVEMLYETQKELIAENPEWSSIDMFEKTTGKQELYNADGIHFTDEGYNYIAECMYEAVTGSPYEAVEGANQVAYYSFDNVSGDSVVNEWGSEAGTLAASANFEEGKYGNALSVTEAGQGMTLTDSDTYDNADWTICYWANPAAVSGEVSVTEDATLSFSTSLKMAADRFLGFRVGNNGGDVLTYSETVPGANEWHHYAWAQSKSSGLTLYMDGVIVKETNAWTASNAVKAPIEVIGGTGFTGLIDDVKIYSTALSASEVAAAMAAPSDGGESGGEEGEVGALVQTVIPFTQTNEDGSLDSNYFTYSASGWSAMGSSTEHVWSDTPSDQNETAAGNIWYEVKFVGSKIDVYAGKNRPMGMVRYWIDGEDMGLFSLYNGSNINSTLITTFADLGEGEHTFKATATGIKDTSSTNTLIDCANVVVYHEPYVAESITLAETEVTLSAGETKELVYSAEPSYAELTDAVFSSSAASVASVDRKGVITAVAPGEATITVKSAAAGLLAEMKVTVIPAVAGIDGSIVSTDKQWTENRYKEVKGMDVKEASLTAWKNDTAVSELAIISLNSAVENVKVEASDLVSGTNKIAAENVTASFIRSADAYNGSFLGYGSTTRPVPADNGSNRAESADIIWSSEPTDIPFNNVQPVWVEFDIPADAKAGVYTATLEVTADGIEEALTFTYEIEVQDAVLADAEDFVDSFDIMQWQYPYSSAEYYDVEPFSEEHFEIIESSMTLYKEAGGNAITATMMEEAWSGQTYSANAVHYPSMIKWTQNADGSFSYDYSDFDAWIGFCKEMGLGEKITVYGLAPWHGSFKYWKDGKLQTEQYSVGNARYVDVWTDFLEAFIDHLEEKGWFDNVYLGIDERGLNAAAFDVVESVTNSEGKALKTSSDIDNITNHWEIAQRVTDLNVGDTAAYTRKAKFQELLEIRKAKGFKTTLYSCTEHQPGQFSLSAPVESYWAVLNAAMMGADGFNRWAYDAWVADPLNDTTHNAFEAGDCFVIFPDEKTAENPTSRSSVRFARMAEGVRDVNKIKKMVAEVPSLSADAADVYANIRYALRTNNSSYLNDTEIAKLSAEAAAFKADLKEMTEKYILLKETGVTTVTSVSIAQGEAASVRMGATLQLEAVVAPENVLNNQVTWSSSDETTATVNADGVVTPVGIGEVTITAVSVADESKKAEITVTVKDAIQIHYTIPQFTLGEEYQSDVFKPDTSAGTNLYYGQPDMVRTKEGRLITAFPQGHGKGPLIMMISDDEGETWTRKTDIPASWAGSMETPTMYVLNLEDGTERIMMITACPGWGLDADGNRYGWNTSYSDDNGETWTEYKHFYSTRAWDNANNDAIVAMSSLIQLKDEDGNDIQKWMGVYHNYSYVNFKTYLTFDENGNEVWSEPEPYLEEHRDIESSHQICEVGLFRSPDGETIVGLARSQSHAHLSTMIVSTDEGETWSRPVEIQGSLLGERHKGAYDPVSGRLLITFREIILDTNHDGVIGSDWLAGDWVAWVGTFEDLLEQNEGEYRILLDEDWANNAKSGDTGYAGVVVLEDGTFILDTYGHWDKDFSQSWTGGVTTDLCYIRQAKFKLSDIEEDNNYEDYYLYALEEIVAEAEALKESEYTAASWENLEEAVAEAKEALKDDGLTNAEAREIYLAVDAAMKRLISGASDDSRDIPVDKLTATAGDYEPNGGASEGPANLVLDGKSSTMWHTDWDLGPNHDNHWLQLEIDGDYMVDGLRYQPRQSGANGLVTGYEVYVSDDAENWTKVAEGTWANDSSWKMASFDAVAAKYVKLQVTDARSDQSIKFASAAEIRLTGTVVGGTVECEHKETELQNVKEATTDEEGYTGDLVCKECDEILEEGTVIPKLEEPKPVENPFEDVTEADYFYNSVLWAVENNVTAGITPTTFEPYTECNRAQIVLFLYRALKGEAADVENPFVDVSEADYCYDAVLWAVENGITTGITETTFEPWKACSRAEIVTFLWRAMGAEKVTTDKTFPDVNAADFFYDAVAWAVENGVTQGRNDGTFGAWYGCWRADAVTFIQRAVEK